MSVLTIPVNGVYFDQIAAGAKLEEYRLCTPFWEKRLAGRSYGAVVMTRGYPKAGGVEGVTRLTRRWQGYQRKTITHPHFGSEPVEVFAIAVAEARGYDITTLRFTIQQKAAPIDPPQPILLCER